MKLEDQVISIKLATKLKELGVKQESVWWWNHIIQEEDLDEWMLDDFNHGSGSSAFTVAELGELLPNGLVTGRRKQWFSVTQNGYIYFDDGTWFEHFSVIRGDTEANARAKALIWLKENKLL